MTRYGKVRVWYCMAWHGTANQVFIVGGDVGRRNFKMCFFFFMNGMVINMVM